MVQKSMYSGNHFFSRASIAQFSIACTLYSVSRVSHCTPIYISSTQRCSFFRSGRKYILKQAGTHMAFDKVETSLKIVVAAVVVDKLLGGDQKILFLL